MEKGVLEQVTIDRRPPRKVEIYDWYKGTMSGGWMLKSHLLDHLILTAIPHKRIHKSANYSTPQLPPTIMRLITFLFAISSSTLIAAELNYCCDLITRKDTRYVLGCCEEIGGIKNISKWACDMAAYKAVSYKNCCDKYNPVDNNHGVCLVQQ